MLHNSTPRFVGSSVRLSVRLLVRLSVRPSVCPSVHLSVCHTLLFCFFFAVVGLTASAQMVKGFQLSHVRKINN